MIVIWVEVATLWNIKSERRAVMETSQQVVWIVRKTWLMCCSFSQIRWPNSLVSIFSLMDSHVWWPDSVMDLTLTVIPFLEVITSVLLMSWVNFREENHSLCKLLLSKTFVN